MLKKIDSLNKPRYPIIDALRGVAVILMIVFHALYDINESRMRDEFPQWVIQSFFTVPLFWNIFSGLIGFLFLFLSGFSLKLRLLDKVTPWSLQFLKPSLRVGIASLLVSAASFIFIKESPVYFGILQCIFASQLLILLFRNLNPLAIVALNLIFLIFGNLENLKLPSVFWALGLSPLPLSTSDYFPLFPWFSAALFGFFCGTYFEKLRPTVVHKNSPFLEYLGRHSLLIYLIHQPIIYGLIQWCAL